MAGLNGYCQVNGKNKTTFTILVWLLHVKGRDLQTLLS